MKKIIYFLLVIAILGAGYLYFTNRTDDSVLIIKSGKVAALDMKCVQNGGKWIAETNECEWQAVEEGQDPQRACDVMGGEYSQCASPCRNNPDAGACITSCAMVCSFNISD